MTVESTGTPRVTAWSTPRAAKRTFDIVGAMALMVLFAPVLPVAAIRIRAHDRGPVIFRQLRVGRDGEPFECLKLRSMMVGAEAMLPELHRASTTPAVCSSFPTTPASPGRGGGCAGSRWTSSPSWSTCSAGR
ncbi:sugar transferase [Nocardioides sp. B-3]|uniref:sugar transferase n=1 Tax=Nocardioides sp. B-3 TaxID=2895565 RepID=UPI00215280F2|nr:sugar transferase [Nocardioides sp. B-3]UUZ57670.1 sugar transferase [Nocardioides sp. B-3]